nr:insulinase family protein [Desulfobulbaceae bacterium]
MKKTARYLSLIFITFYVITMAAQIAQAGFLKPHLFKEKLENGMTVLVKEVPGVKAVTVQIWVKAGSIYEGPTEGGITHLIEHMIFKGTKSRGAGQIAAEIEERGGQINAYTSYEYTVYHATLSARFWEPTLEVLTDAVLNSVFDSDELEREKKVVLEEINMRNDRPQMMLYQEMMTNSYDEHPYRLPIIGTPESVSSFTRDDILHYLREHYVPENFTAVVVGDVAAGPVIEKVKELFSALPAGKPKERVVQKEPPKTGPKLFKVIKDVNQSQLAMTLPIPAFKDKDTPIIDVLSSILGNGETSWLYNELRNEKGLVYNISASAFTPKDEGLFEISATLDKENIEQAMEVALTELFKFKYVQVEEKELDRVKRSLESDFIFNLERVDGQARVLGSFNALTGDPREDDYLERVRAVTKEDLMRVANIYFTGKNLTAGYLAPNGTDIGLTVESLAALIERAEVAAQAAIPTSLVKESYLSNLHRFTLSNGVRLLVRENYQVPTVSIRAVFPGGLRGETLETNGAFAFISELLPKSTANMTSRELSLMIHEMAGDISGFNGKNTFGLKASFLSRYFKDGMKLVADVLLRPAFDQAEADKIKPERIASLKQQEDNLAALAFTEFNRVLFQSHPYGLNTLGSEEAIQGLTSEILQNIYKEHAKPEDLVLAISGDVRADEVYVIVEKLFGRWVSDQQSDNLEEFLAPAVPDKPVSFEISRDREQVHIVIGFIGTHLKSEDRYALEILETVLNGQSGRLFRQLRDKQSLAYSLSSFTLLGVDTGSLGIYIGTSPDKKQEAIDSAWKELDRMRNEPISDEELKKAKNIIVGHYELSLQTNGSQAMDIALSEAYGLGQDFGHKYIHEVTRITAADVMRVAQKYLLPEHHVMVTVGAE